MSNSDGLAALKIDRSPRRNGVPRWPFVVVVLLLASAFAAPDVIRYFDVVDVSVAPAVKIRTAGGKDMSQLSGSELSAAGYIVADRQSTLAAKVTGLLTKLNVTESQHVKQGEIVAEVDHREIDSIIIQAETDCAAASADVEQQRFVAAQADAELASSRAPLATIEAEIREIDVTLADARRRLERDRSVVEQNALPATNVEDRLTEVRAAEAKIATTGQRLTEQKQRVAVAQSQLASARNAITVAQTKVRSAEARLQVLRTQLLDYFVIAPYDGVVTEKMAQVGEIVAPISIGGSMARGSLITLADWSSLLAEVDVAETQLERVRPGAPALLSVDAFPNKAYAGKIRRILPRADRSKATVKVHVEFAQRDDSVLPEMGVRVKFLAQDAATGGNQVVRDQILVPKAALHGAAGAQFVWIVSNGRAAKRLVTPGAILNDQQEIGTGLSGGEQVITQGADKLNDDQKVRVQ